MQDQDQTQPELPGNTGDWYFDLLGVTPETDEAAPRDGGEQTEFVIDGESESTSIATPIDTGMDESETTLELEPAPRADAAPDWQPAAAAPPTDRRIQFRWWMVIVPAVIVAIVVAGALWLPTTSDAEARDEARDYIGVLDDMRATLPDVQQTLATATEPASTPIDLLPLTGRLSTLQAAAGAVATRASRELPETLPMAPRAPLEDLIPTRQRMQVLASQGLAIADRIATTIDYRTTLDGILVYPSLPVRADPRQIDVLSGELADTLAASSATAADLPSDDPAFTAHRERVQATVASFDDWRESYLDALRREDQNEAAALIDDAAELRRELFTSIVPALASVRSEVDAEIIQLNDDISGAIRAVPVP